MRYFLQRATILPFSRCSHFFLKHTLFLQKKKKTVNASFFFQGAATSSLNPYKCITFSMRGHLFFKSIQMHNIQKHTLFSSKPCKCIIFFSAGVTFFAHVSKQMQWLLPYNTISATFFLPIYFEICYSHGRIRREKGNLLLITAQKKMKRNKK